MPEQPMISVSHWGMFPAPERAKLNFFPYQGMPEGVFSRPLAATPQPVKLDEEV